MKFAGTPPYENILVFFGRFFFAALGAALAFGVFVMVLAATGILRYAGF